MVSGYCYLLASSLRAPRCCGAFIPAIVYFLVHVIYVGGRDVPRGVSERSLALLGAPLILAAMVTGQPPKDATCAETREVATRRSDGEAMVATSLANGQQLVQAQLYQEAANVLEDVVRKTAGLGPNSEDPHALLLLADAYQNLGQSNRAARLLDYLLGLETLTTDGASLVLNRRGICLAATGDFLGARESYEQALSIRPDNAHARYNLAHLLHFSVAPMATTTIVFQILLLAVDLYRGALGYSHRHDDTMIHKPDTHDWKVAYLAATATQEAITHSQAQQTTSETPKRSQEEFGGPVDRVAISRDLALAFMETGQSSDAVEALQTALLEHEERRRKAATDGGHASRTSQESQEAAHIWGSLASARFHAGDVFGAISANNRAIELVENDPILYHNAGIVFQKAGLINDAETAMGKAVLLDPNLVSALTSLGHLAGARGDTVQARRWYGEALAAATTSEMKHSSNERSRHGHAASNARSEGVATSMFLIATAAIPIFSKSNDHIIQVRTEVENALDELLSRQVAEHMIVEHPVTTVGSGSLGYYLVYQGFEDKQIRRKLAQVYWKYAPSLRYCASFILREGKDDHPTLSLSSKYEGIDRHQPATSLVPSETSTVVLADSSFDLAEQFGKDNKDPMIEELNQQSMASSAEEGLSHGKRVPGGSVGSTGYVSANVISSTTPVTEVEGWKTGVAVNLPPEESYTSEGTACRRRLHIGFLSAFFFHHSVGLLTQGVVTRLDRTRFETTAIFLQPHPTSTFGERSKSKGASDSWKGGDDVYNAIRKGTENVLDIPAGSRAACLHAIASLELDVLVFTEIGMDLDTYFLSFARLARRSVLFWGHAVTSGISAFDGISTIDGKTGSSRETGGVDYFISSWLFENQGAGRHAQRKYTERLYLMRGLTTRFVRPQVPAEGLVTRELLDIPPRPPVFSPSPSSRNQTAKSPANLVGGGQKINAGGSSAKPQWCGALYLVPQTLYKLHPDFDDLVAAVLNADPWGCAIFIQASKPRLTDGVSTRMTKALRAAGVVSLERIFFIPPLNSARFFALSAMADVVLDPFPVGGGRSSLEVLAVGTPVVMLYNKTSILQLTYGMYKTMGLEGPIANFWETKDSPKPVSLVTYSTREFVDSVVAIATNAQVNDHVRRLILSKNHRLYDQDSAVSEWEHFLQGIVAIPRPTPVDNRLLAMDASDLPQQSNGHPPWCTSRLNHNSSASNLDPDNRRMSEASDHSREVRLRSDLHTNRMVLRPTVRSITASDVISGRQPERLPVHVAHEHRVNTEGEGPAISENDDPNRLLQTQRNNRLSSAVEAATDHAGDIVSPIRKQNDDAHFASEERQHGSHEKQSDLLYAVEFTVEPDHIVGEQRHLSAQVSSTADPLGDARRLMEQGGLDNLQYRWIEAVLCRATRRVGRSVVWAKDIVVDGRPSSRLEVRQGDDLFQVAKWHADRNGFSRGAEHLWATLEQEIPQHVHPEWISSRSQDYKNCQNSIGVSSSGASAAYNASSFPGNFDHPERAFSNTSHSYKGVDKPQRNSPMPSSLRRALNHSIEDQNENSRVRNRDGGSSGTRNEKAVAREPSESNGDEGVGQIDDQDREFNDKGRWSLASNGSDDECVTLAITTCKRVHEFMGTAAGLKYLLGDLLDVKKNDTALPERNVPRVCEVLVVDDGSSREDQLLMARSFPEFSFVYKAPDHTQKGHAGSMNLILSLVRTQYLLYVEDDWWPVHPTKPFARESADAITGSFLRRAMDVIRLSPEGVAQVLINDQSSRACAHGDLVSCPSGLQGSSAGWRRFTRYPRTSSSVTNPDPSTGHSDECCGQPWNTKQSCPSQAYAETEVDMSLRDMHQPCGEVERSVHGRSFGDVNETGSRLGDDYEAKLNGEISRTARGNSSFGKSMVDNEGGVEYRLHEFGVMYPSHAFAFWPGFSLNPALWDLRKLQDRYQRQYGERLHFDSADTRFEQRMSMRLLDAGVLVAYLPDVTFQHVGVGISAYVANAMPRPWDVPSSTVDLLS